MWGGGGGGGGVEVPLIYSLNLVNVQEKFHHYIMGGRGILLLLL